MHVVRRKPAREFRMDGVEGLVEILVEENVHVVGARLVDDGVSQGTRQPANPTLAAFRLHPLQIEQDLKARDGLAGAFGGGRRPFRHRHTNGTLWCSIFVIISRTSAEAAVLGRNG